MDSPFPRVALPVVAALLAGCGAGWPLEPGGAGRPGVLVVRVASGPGWQPVHEVAFQDGDGPWQALALGAGSLEVEVRDPLGRYGVAVSTVQSFQGGLHQRSTTVGLWTLAERATFDVGSSGHGDGVMLPNVRVTGLAAGKVATLNFGREQRWLQATQAGAWAQLPPGTADLVVGLPSLSEAPDRVLVRRGLVVGPRGTLEVDVREAQEVARRPLSLSGWGADDWVATRTSVRPANAAAPVADACWANLGQRYARGAGAELAVLPEALADPGDRYRVEAWAITEGPVSEIRTLGGPLEALEGGAELPSPAGGTFGTDPEGHPAWGWSLQPPGAGLQLALSGPEPRGYRSLFVSATPGWRGGASSFTLTSTGSSPALHAANAGWPLASNWAVFLDQVTEGPSCSRPGVVCSSWTSGTP